MPELFESNESDWKLVSRGKVRDIYEFAPSELLIVTTDRLSAFDVILPTPIPDKGMVLTQISNFWFAKTSDIVANHVIDPDPFSSDGAARASGRPLGGRAHGQDACRWRPSCAATWPARAGRSTSRAATVCGMQLPAGLQESSQLPEPIFTPSTKAAIGDHDENIPFEKTVELLGEELAAQVRDTALALYGVRRRPRARARHHHRRHQVRVRHPRRRAHPHRRGAHARLVALLAGRRLRARQAQPSFDKQYVRDYLETLDWDKTAPGPELPADVAARTADKYREAWRRLTQG